MIHRFCHNPNAFTAKCHINCIYFIHVSTYVQHSNWLFRPIGSSPLGNSGCFPRGKPAASESCYPTYSACWVCECFHSPPNSDLDYRIFNVRTDLNAYDCTQGCADTVRKSALNVDSGEKKSLAALGNRNSVSGMPVRRSTNWATSPPKIFSLGRLFFLNNFLQFIVRKKNFLESLDGSCF